MLFVEKEEKINFSEEFYSCDQIQKTNENYSITDYSRSSYSDDISY